MVKLDKIRSDLESQLQIDKSLHYVDVRADTLEEALSDASVQLGVKISCLEYEVLEKGFSGFLGLAKQPWFIRVYENSDSTGHRSLGHHRRTTTQCHRPRSVGAGGHRG